jgi:uncharacterized protein YajQ (UPF0234 family)
MKYSFILSKVKMPHIFAAFENAIAYISNNNDFKKSISATEPTDTHWIIKTLKTEYNVKIEPARYVNDVGSVHDVEFDSEEDYVFFMLKFG